LEERRVGDVAILVPSRVELSVPIKSLPGMVNAGGIYGTLEEVALA